MQPDSPEPQRELQITIDGHYVTCEVPRGINVASEEFYKRWVKPSFIALQARIDPESFTGSIIELRRKP